MGYIDATGRAVIESFSAETNRLVNNEDYEEAYDKFLSLGRIVEEEAGTVAVNLRRITDKLVRNPSGTMQFQALLSKDQLRANTTNTNQTNPLGYPTIVFRT